MEFDGRWSSLVLGTLISLALTGLLILLGMGLGLSFMPLERLPHTPNEVLGIGVLGGVFLALATSVSTTLGAYFAFRVFRTGREPFVHAMGFWGLITTIQLGLALSVWGNALSKGATLTGAGVGALSFWEEFRRTNPRIVSDLKVLDGKVVTTFQMDRSATLPAVADRAEKTTEQLIAESTVEKARVAMAGLSLLGFLCGLMSLGGSILGAQLAHRHSNSKTSRPAVRPLRTANANS